MDIFLLKKYHEIKLPFQPPFYEGKCDRYIEIVGPEALIKLTKLMGSERHTVITHYHYMVMLYNYKLFLEGKKPRQGEDYFDFPISTSTGHFAIFEKYPAHLKKF
jgi:hypothetical protein